MCGSSIISKNPGHMYNRQQANLLFHTNITHQQNNGSLRAKLLSSVRLIVEEHFGELISRLFIYIKNIINTESK
jgi:hypothetical protein